MEINNILSNKELYELATAEGSPAAALFSKYDTYDEFADYISGLNTAEAHELANKFLEISMAWYDKEMFVEEAADILEEQGFGEKESMAYAGMMRNLYVKVSNPVEPKFKNIQNGAGTSPYMVRKPEVTEIFYTFNADYQNYITVQNVEMKTAFASAYGVSELIAKVMEGLRNKFVEWVYNKKLEVLNLLVNDENLKDSQVVEVTMDSYSNAELQNLSNVIDNAISALTLTANGAFNMKGWKQRERKENLRLLMRPLIDNAAKNYVTPYAFNDVILKNDVKKVYIENFGGLIPQVDINGTLTDVEPIYDEENRNTDTFKAEGSETVYTLDDIVWKDPNEDILAVIANKDIMKMIEQEGYIVEGAYNQSNRATTFWASEANVGFIYDRYKNIIVIKKKAAEPVTKDYVTITAISPEPMVLNENTSGNYTVNVDTAALLEDYGIGITTMRQSTNLDTAVLEFDPERLTSTSESTGVEVTVDTMPATTETGVIKIELLANDEVIEEDTIPVTVEVSVPNSNIAPVAGLQSTRKRTTKKSSK